MGKLYLAASGARSSFSGSLMSAVLRMLFRVVVAAIGLAVLFDRAARLSAIAFLRASSAIGWARRVRISSRTSESGLNFCFFGGRRVRLPVGLVGSSSRFGRGFLVGWFGVGGLRVSGFAVGRLVVGVVCRPADHRCRFRSRSFSVGGFVGGLWPSFGAAFFEHSGGLLGWLLAGFPALLRFWLLFSARRSSRPPCSRRADALAGGNSWTLCRPWLDVLLVRLFDLLAR